MYTEGGGRRGQRRGRGGAGAVQKRAGSEEPARYYSVILRSLVKYQMSKEPAMLPTMAMRSDGWIVRATPM